MNTFFRNIFRQITAAVLFAVLLPFTSLIAFILFIILRENPFFIQERGLTLIKGKIKIIKFKTLKNEFTRNRRKNNDIFYKDELSSGVNRFSSLLRRTGFDELPQLINIAKGEMAFVGPRPLMKDDLEIMKRDFNILYNLRNELNCKPGLTGLWQLLGKRENGIYDLLLYDNLYDQSKSFILDIKIILVTLPYSFFAYNSDSIIKGRRSFFGSVVSKEKRAKIRNAVIKFLGIENKEAVMRIKLKSC